MLGLWNSRSVLWSGSFWLWNSIAGLWNRLSGLWNTVAKKWRPTTTCVGEKCPKHLVLRRLTQEAIRTSGALRS